MTAYLEPGALAVSLGTSLAPPDAVESGDLHQVAVRIKRVRATLQGFRQILLYGARLEGATDNLSDGRRRSLFR
jgi:hypothetical protein